MVGKFRQKQADDGRLLLNKISPQQNTTLYSKFIERDIYKNKFKLPVPLVTLNLPYGIRYEPINLSP